MNGLTDLRKQCIKTLRETVEDLTSPAINERIRSGTTSRSEPTVPERFLDHPPVPGTVKEVRSSPRSLTGVPTPHSLQSMTTTDKHSQTETTASPSSWNYRDRPSRQEIRRGAAFRLAAVGVTLITAGYVVRRAITKFRR